MKVRMFALVVLLGTAAMLTGCGVWDAITNDGTDEVMLKGEKGATCTVDSDCRSNSCVFPGVCE